MNLHSSKLTRDLTGRFETEKWLDKLLDKVRITTIPHCPPSDFN